MLLSDKDIMANSRMIEPFVDHKVTNTKYSYGLEPSGYTCRINSHTILKPLIPTILTTLEYFDIPNGISAQIAIKSSHMRNKIGGFFSYIEPKYRGHLQFLFINFDTTDYTLNVGDGIAQIHFFKVKTHSEYSGKYNNKK